MSVAHTSPPTLRSISYRVVVRCFLAVFFTRHNFVHAGFFQSVQLFLFCLLRSFVTRVFALGSSGRPSSFNSQFSRCLRSRSRSLDGVARTWLLPRDVLGHTTQSDHPQCSHKKSLCHECGAHFASDSAINPLSRRHPLFTPSFDLTSLTRVSASLRSPCRSVAVDGNTVFRAVLQLSQHVHALSWCFL